MHQTDFHQKQTSEHNQEGIKHFPTTYVSAAASPLAAPESTPDGAAGRDNADECSQAFGPSTNINSAQSDAAVNVPMACVAITKFIGVIAV